MSNWPSIGPRRRWLADLERLQASNAPWHAVRARLSHEEPAELRALYRAPELKSWLGELATPSQLVDTVERIGGPLPQQLAWLIAAGVKLAPRDARLERALDAGDEALLDRFDRYRSITELEAERDALLQREMSMLRSARAIEGVANATHFTERYDAIQRTRDVALREAGLDEAAWIREKAAFDALFRAHALTTAHRMLRRSRAAIRDVRDRYASGEAIASLRALAAPLRAKELEVVDRYRKRTSLLSKEAGETPASIEALDRLLKAEAERDALRASLAEAHALFRDPELDVAALAASSAECRRELDRLTAQRLADVEAMHQHLDEDTTLVFRLDRVLEEAKSALSIADGSAGEALIESAVDRAASRETVRNFACAALAAGLGLLSGVGGAIGLAASALGTSLGVLSTADSVHEYRIEASAARTHFERAQALSSREPSAFWLAIDIAGTVLDAGAFAKSFTALHRAAETAVAARSAAELEDARGALAAIAGRAPQGSVEHREALLRSAWTSVERERARTALLDAHPELARAIAERHPLPPDAIAGLIALDDDARDTLLKTFAAEPRALARIGRLAGASKEAALGLQRLAGAVDDAAFSALARELAAWRNPDRARGVIEKLGHPRFSVDDASELAHALASRGSPSGRAQALETFAREHLPLTRAEADAFAREHGVSVLLHEAGESREVRVDFIARDGLVDDLRIEVGARATLDDLQGHCATVEKIAVYRGLLRRAARVLDRLTGSPPPGSAAFEAKLELEKLPARLRAWERRQAGTITPERLDRFEADGRALERQLDDAQRVLDEAGDAPGWGSVAARDAEALDRLDHLREWPAYREVARLEGKTLEEVLAHAKLRSAFDAHYYSNGRARAADAEGISRRPGHVDQVPLLHEENGRLRFVATEERAAPILLPRGSTAEVLASLANHSQSWTQWRDVLRSKKIVSDRELAALAEKILGGKTRPATVAQLRDALKDATRSRLVDHCFDGVEDGAESHGRLTAIAYELNTSDQGSVAELWYARYSETQLGVKLEQHVQMLPADNPKLEAPRVPDNIDISGKRLVEVKSTARGLRTDDKEQITAMLNAFEKPSKKGPTAIVRKDGAVHAVNRFTLTFIHPQGALGSADSLYEWLNRFESFELEVLDAEGRLHRITRAELQSKKLTKDELVQRLRVWANL